MSPIKVIAENQRNAEISFSITKKAEVTVEFGKSLTKYDKQIDCGTVSANKTIEVMLPNLDNNDTYFVRLKAKYDHKTYYGGDFWIFTPPEQ